MWPVEAMKVVCGPPSLLEGVLEGKKGEKRERGLVFRRVWRRVWGRRGLGGPCGSSNCLIRATTSGWSFTFWSQRTAGVWSTLVRKEEKKERSIILIVCR